jgi:hypothetical protein
MKRLALVAATCLALGSAATAQARQVTVTITNLTNGNYFTPLLVAAHSRHVDLFELATPASSNLQAMAEGGVIDGLADEILDAGGEVEINPNGGELAPGDSTTANLSLHGWSNRRLTVLAMILPTNDGFVGLDSIRIPRRPGTYTFFARGYDAGTEANDEIVNGGGAPGIPGIPGDPGGNSGVGASGAAGADFNPTVHVHRGVLGDLDPLGGVSDLDATIHRWQGPVARIVVKVGHR